MNRNALHVNPEAKLLNNTKFAERIMSVVSLPEMGRVLEVGCGGGELLKTLTDTYNLDCYGIEPFPIYAYVIDPTRVITGVSEHINFENNNHWC